MRKLLTSLFIGIFAFALTTQGAEVKKATKAAPKRGGGAAHGNAHVQTNRVMVAHVNTGARVHTQHNITAVNHTGSHVITSANRHHTVTNSTNAVTAANTTNAVRANRVRNATVNAQQNAVVNPQQNVVVNRQRNVAVRNAVVTNNWRTARFSAPQYSAFQNYHRAYHDRGWYSNNYNNVVFVLGGWWYWNDPYWYPAWGYAPRSYYPYDGPIYGYNSLTPDRIVVQVQSQLQRDGYYTGAVDGVLGRHTRRALAAYQADHGLVVTSAIDQPTLNTLGLS
ncbi:MAG: peptidoglycan-binding domain-containing protein [Chthoniobacterales bacterium]